MKPLKFTSEIHGVLVTLEQRRCVACTKYTFNAGLVCRRCLNRGCEPLPDRLRGSDRTPDLRAAGAYPQEYDLSPMRLRDIVRKCGKEA